MSETKMERLIDLAKWLHGYQDQKGWKDAQMFRRFPGLGSSKTFRDIREGKAESYDVEGWIPEYEMVKNEIEAGDLSAVGREIIFSNLSSYVMVKRAALGAMKTNGSNRVVIVQAPSGGGKSCAINGLVDTYGSRIIFLEAVDTWNDKPRQLLAEILEACGFDNAPRSPTACLKAVVKYLKQSRRMLAIDEAHHMGPHCINTIKALVNKTPGEFMLLAMGTLWNKLECDSAVYQEAAQLVKNRLYERVVIGFDIKDVARFLKHRFEGVSKADLSKMSTAVKQSADNNGNMSFVRGVCDNALDMKGDEVVVSFETVVEAVKAESAKRSKCKS